MSITGGIKFFDKSRSLQSDGTTIVASTGDPSAEYCIDRSLVTYWRSVGSDDTTTETLTITFPSSQTFDRIFIIDHNFLDFNIQYDSGGWTHFANVIGLDGSKANITETAFSDDTGYYEFDSVTTTQVRIQCLKTQVANAEKYLNQFIISTELGTLVGFPKPTFSQQRNKISQVLSGKRIIEKIEEADSLVLSFAPYPLGSTYNADIDLMYQLFDREDDFLVWLCGGRRGDTYYRYSIRGFRLRDVKQVQIGNEQFTGDYLDNYYRGFSNLEVQLFEVA